MSGITVVGLGYTQGASAKWRYYLDAPNMRREWGNEMPNRSKAMAALLDCVNARKIKPFTRGADVEYRL